MSSLQQLTDIVAASLWGLPASLDELNQRESFRTIAPFGLALVVETLLESGRIYQRGEKYCCYQRTAAELVTLDFDLDMKEPEFKSEFRQSFEKSMKYL